VSVSETHQIVLVKPAQRQLRPQVIDNNITSLLGSVNNKSLKVRGWTVASTATECDSWSKETVLVDDGSEYIYSMYLTVSYQRDDDKQPGNNDLASILRNINIRASQPAFGKWTLDKVNGTQYVVADTGDVVSADLLGYAEVELPEDWSEHFDHLFGLDAHVTRVLRALEAGVMSGWNNRYHVALVGPPGCGKSDICQSIKRALGEDAVMEFDATATTAAGAIKELTEREILPRVLLVEEIEKADEKALAFLLSVLDLRSEIRKTTARATIQRDTKLFAICTVNNVELFKRLQAGALASRFANKVWFKRPSREQLALILTREVERMNGDPAWINPTLDYCDAKGITDPRQVIAICLCGREMLVTGEYQKMLAATDANGSDDDENVTTRRL
jgi:hypothetical protein